MNNQQKYLIIAMLVLSLMIGICYGYMEGIPVGFNQAYEKFQENPPGNCYCSNTPKTDTIFEGFTLPILTK